MLAGDFAFWDAAPIILGAAALVAAGMLVVRRRAQRSFFKDPIPAAAVYTVVGTAYMVIVAFVFFVAHELACKASGLVPPVVWLILIVGGAVVVAGVGFFADSREPRLTQAGMMVAVVVIVVSRLLLVRFLDRPYEDKSGSIKLTAIARTLAEMEREHQCLAGAHSLLGSDVVGCLVPAED